MLRSRGFTVIELLVVLAAVAVLLSLATPRYLAHLERAREATLRHNLQVLREALDQYRADRGHAPTELQALVQGRYLRALPEDPITQRRNTWVPVMATPESGAEGMASGAQGGVVDVRSGASGQAQDGSAYGSW